MFILNTVVTFHIELAKRTRPFTFCKFIILFFRVLFTGTRFGQNLMRILFTKGIDIAVMYT